jgi:signal transduction histidine kinase
VTTRMARTLAVSLTVLYIVIGATGLALQFATARPEEPVFGLPGMAISAFIFLAWSTIGGVVASRRPRNPIGWILSGLALDWAIQNFTFGYATYALVTHPGALPAGAFAALTYNAIFFLGGELLIVLLFLLFPDGHPLSPRWRLVGWVAAVVSAFLFLGTYVTSGPIESFGIENPYGVTDARGVGWAVFGWALVLLLFGALLASAAGLIVRLGRARGDLRQQMRWFVYAASFLPISFAFIFFGPNRTTDVIGATLLAVAIAGMPVAAAIAIFRYRLYDIDIVIRRTVVVGVLVSFATAVYLAIVVGVGTLVGSSGRSPNVVLAVVATAIVAVAFQPVRAWARRLANRFVYGERATPYDVLSDFSDRLAGTFDTTDLLPRMARMLAEGTGAVRGDVWLRVGNQLRAAGSWPTGDAPSPVPLTDGATQGMEGRDLVVPVLHQGELLGALTVSKRPGEPPTPIEERLVTDLGAQAGLVLSNARLIEELRASRQRLVAAQDEERRKLERNIHDGAQQQLVALAVKARLADSLVGSDDAKAHGLLAQIQDEMRGALEDLRDLARGIYPPLLADQGLAAALQAQVRRSAVPLTVEADGVSRYPQEAEAAVYFCALEALQNVAKYAQASRVSVRLSASDGHLSFSVQDDGIGFDQAAKGYGTGLQGMSDRIAALGGELRVTSTPGTGTVVEGSVPIEGVSPLVVT